MNEDLVYVLRQTGITVLAVMAIGVGIIVFGNLIGNAMDMRFDNRDRMLCAEALKSGNKEYFERCQCYYEGDSIRCIYEIPKGSTK